MTTFFIARVPWHEKAAAATPPVLPEQLTSCVIKPRVVLAAPKLPPPKFKDVAWAAEVEPVLPKSRVVHISDLNDFCRCKRAWNWSSQLRRGLQPSVSPVPLFMGSAIHWALDHGYQGCVGKDIAHFDLDAALIALRTWMNAHIKRTVEYTGPLWDEEKQDVRGCLDLGVLMLRHYALWAAPLDRLFRVLGMEYKFKVPLPGPHGMEYAGRFDGLIQDIKTGTKYILEFKTAKSIASPRGGISSNISGVLRGMQASAYTWASGQVYDEPAQGVLYRFLLKRVPDSPKPLQRGGYSKAKSIKSTDVWFAYVLDRVAAAKYEGLDESKSHVTLREMQDLERQDALEVMQRLRMRNQYTGGVATQNDFFLQLPMTKKPRQIQGAVDAIVNEGQRMLDPTQAIYPTCGFHCNWCQFKTPCDLIARGMDDAAEGVLAAAYGPRTYWEPEIVKEY